jgi:hypothetical protein
VASQIARALGWGGSVNETFASSIARARAFTDCARSLYRDGFLSECHGYMCKALSLHLEAWSDAADNADAEPVGLRASRERAFEALARAGYRRIDRLRAAAEAIDSPPGAEVGCPNSVDFDWIWTEVERLAPFSARQALTPRARKLLRLRRGLLAAFSVALALVLAFRIWGRPRAQASAAYADTFSAENAVDGLEATEWLLPDSTAGWVDVILPFARTVKRVRLINAHNRISADRAARAVRVTAFTKQGSSVSVEGAFKHFSEDRSVLDLDLAARDVTRIRVEVLSHFRTGGGLAEVELQ